MEWNSQLLVPTAHLKFLRKKNEKYSMYWVHGPARYRSRQKNGLGERPMTTKSMLSRPISLKKQYRLPNCPVATVSCFTANSEIA